MPGRYTDTSSGPHHRVWNACRPSAMLPCDGNHLVIPMSPAQDSMFHYQRVLKNPQTHAAAFSALNTRDILAQHTCLFAVPCMAWVSLSLHALKQPRYLNTDTRSSSSPYAVNHILRASWESLAAACCHFHAMSTGPDITPSAYDPYLGLPWGFTYHTDDNAGGAICPPLGFSQDGWGGASLSDTLYCTLY